MKLTEKQVEAIKRLLAEEGFTPEEIMVGVTAVIITPNTADQIKLARSVAREHRLKESQKPAPGDEPAKTYPCRECAGTGWVSVTRGWTVGGARIEPGQKGQPAVAMCGVCHGVKYVLEPSPEPERISLAEHLSRHADSPLAQSGAFLRGGPSSSAAAAPVAEPPPPPESPPASPSRSRLL